MFQRKNTSSTAKGVFGILQSVSKKLVTAAKRPDIAITYVLSTYVVLTQAVKQYQIIPCPSANSVTNALNATWANWTPTYCGNNSILEPYINFQNNRNPLEDFSGAMEFKDNCVAPYIQLAPAVDLAAYNTNNFTLLPGYNISFIGCRYTILSASISLLSDYCFPTPETPEDCALFQRSNSSFEVATAMLDTSCQILNSTFSCVTDKALSPLTGIWQSKDNQYPHLTFNNLDNSITYQAITTQSYPPYTNCPAQYYGNATDLSGAFFKAPNNTFKLIVDTDFSKTILLNQSTQCQELFKNNQANNLYTFLSFASANDFVLLDSNTLQINVYDVYTGNSSTMALSRVQGGNLFYQDGLNNTYGFSSTFNITQANIAAEMVSQRCNLNLSSIASLPSRLSLFNVSANDGCMTENHAMEMDYYSQVAQEILNCTSNVFLAFTSSKAMRWPTWDCPPQEGQLSQMSSSTGRALSSTAGISALSSTASSSASNDQGESASSLDPRPFLIAGGVLLAALISAIAYKCYRYKKRTIDAGSELAPIQAAKSSDEISQISPSEIGNSEESQLHRSEESIRLSMV